MNTITEELVTISINGNDTECYVWGHYYPAHDGGHDEPSEPENYELNALYMKQGDNQVEISEILMIDFVRDDIVKQIKENASE